MLDNEETKEEIMKEIKSLVIENSRNGNIVVLNEQGLMKASLNEFINQPAEGMLYDLNRVEPVVLAFIKDPKWVNDYACAQVIRALKAKVDFLTEENKKLKEEKEKEKDINGDESRIVQVYSSGNDFFSIDTRKEISELLGEEFKGLVFTYSQRSNFNSYKLYFKNKKIIIEDDFICVKQADSDYEIFEANIINLMTLKVGTYLTFVQFRSNPIFYLMIKQNYELGKTEKETFELIYNQLFNNNEQART